MPRVRIDKFLERSAAANSVIITDANREPRYIVITGNGKYVGTDASGNVGIFDLPSSGSVAAENGLTVASLKAVLGQAIGAVGDPAKLLSNREIPMNGFSFQFKESTWVPFKINPDGTVSLKKQIQIEQAGQPGNSVITIRQDPGIDQTDSLMIQRNGTSTSGGADPAYTLLTLAAPDLKSDEESTFALLRKGPTGQEVEFLDLYNNGYRSNGAINYGIRIQKRVNGLYRDFAFEYADSNANVMELYRIVPGSQTGNFTNAFFDMVLATLRLKNGKAMHFCNVGSGKRVAVKALDGLDNDYTLQLPPDPGKVTQPLRTDGSGNLKFEWGTITYRTSSYTATLSDETILCNFPTNGTITLPSADLNTGKTFSIKKIFGAGIITVQPVGGDTIDGGANYVIGGVNDSITIISDGDNWFVRESVTSSSGALYTASSVGTTLANVTWSGTAPTGIAYRHRWSRVGNLTTVEIHGFGTVAQTSTGVAFDLPTNCPSPDEWYTTQNAQFAVAASFGSNANAPINASRGIMSKTATGWRVDCACASTALRYFSVTITYRSVPGTGSTEP